MTGPDDFAGLFDGATGGDDDIADADIARVLDSAAMIQSRDHDSWLWSLATAGSQIRRAVAASPAWLARLDGAQRPRSVLVVTDPYLAGAGPLLAELGGTQVPVLPWRQAELPRWAGPADVLLAASIDGTHPRVAALAADADRRGLTVVVFSPDDSPAAVAAGRGIRVPIEGAAPYRASVWSVLAPILLAGQALGVHLGEVSPGAVDPETLPLLGPPEGHSDTPVADTVLEEAARALDDLAARCGPMRETYHNEAKQVAIDFAEADPVLIGCGALPTLAATSMAGALNAGPGAGAVWLSLPDELAAALALLAPRPGSPRSAADFFRDRVDEPTRSRRFLALNPPLVEPSSSPPALIDRPDGAPDLLELATARAAATVRDAAARSAVRYSVSEPDPSCALVGYAQQCLLGEFVAAYLTIGSGADLPSDGSA